MAWKSEAPTQPGFYWLIAPGWEQPIVGQFSEGTWLLLGDEVPYKTDDLSRHMKFWDEPLKLPPAMAGELPWGTGEPGTGGIR
jgi:hypothetical protein